MTIRPLSRFLLRSLPRVGFVTLLSVVLVALPVAQDPDGAAYVALRKPRPQLLSDVEIELTLVARVPRPTAMATRYRDDALYVASKRGEIFRVDDDETEVVLNVRDELSSGFEQGLLGLAFTPDGRSLVVNFTNKKGTSITRVYRFDEKADPKSGKDLLQVRKPAAQHNAGNLTFGPDDYLYLSLGDGGLSGDPDNNAQSLDTLLGKIHRIEVLPDGTYQIPPDNPFEGKKKVRDEIWAYGFRNPWRFSFDKTTGDLWISDVGRDQREEINYEPGDSQGGLNYGWNRMEGRRRFRDQPLPKEHVLPVHDYKHKGTVCAVSGGFVYRGENVPGLHGAYLFSDFCKGGIEAIRIGHDEEVSEHREFDVDATHVSSFGQDADGELYVLMLDAGEVYRIDAG